MDIDQAKEIKRRIDLVAEEKLTASKCVLEFMSNELNDALADHYTNMNQVMKDLHNFGQQFGTKAMGFITKSAWSLGVEPKVAADCLMGFVNLCRDCDTRFKEALELCKDEDSGFEPLSGGDDVFNPFSI